MRSLILGAVLGVAITGGAGAADGRLALPEEYLLITGGWYLNARCDFLNEQGFAEFRTNLMQLDEVARLALDKSYVAMLRGSAWEMAFGPTHGACGDDARAVVMETAKMAQSFTVATDEAEPVLPVNEPIPEI